MLLSCFLGTLRANGLALRRAGFLVTALRGFLAEEDEAPYGAARPAGGCDDARFLEAGPYIATNGTEVRVGRVIG